MDSLDDVSTIIEDSPDVLRVHGTREVGVAVVSAVLLGVPLEGCWEI